VRNWRGADLDRTGVGFVEQPENIKQRAFAAAGRAYDGVSAPGLQIE